MLLSWYRGELSAMVFVIAILAAIGLRGGVRDDMRGAPQKVRLQATQQSQSISALELDNVYHS
mgnify:CR=1 FL=1